MDANKAMLQRAGEIIDSYGCKRENIIAIMQDIQAEYKYLSGDVLSLIAEKLDIGVAKVYSVATFYENFSLEAKGRHISVSPAKDRPRTTAFTRWKRWRVWAPAVWLPL